MCHFVHACIHQIIAEEDLNAHARRKQNVYTLVLGEGLKHIGKWKNEEQAKVQSKFQSQTPKKVQEEQEIIVCT